MRCVAYRWALSIEKRFRAKARLITLRPLSSRLGILLEGPSSRLLKTAWSLVTFHDPSATYLVRCFKSHLIFRGHNHAQLSIVGQQLDSHTFIHHHSRGIGYTSIQPPPGIISKLTRAQILKIQHRSNASVTKVLSICQARMQISIPVKSKAGAQLSRSSCLSSPVSSILCNVLYEPLIHFPRRRDCAFPVSYTNIHSSAAFQCNLRYLQCLADNFAKATSVSTWVRQ